MNPVIDLTNIISGLYPDSLTYTYKVPEDDQKMNKLPLIKIEAVNDVNESYGSDKYRKRRYNVQVMAFLNIEKTEIEGFKDILDRELESNEFYLTYADEYMDEDYENVIVLTRQYTTTRRKN